MKAITNKKIRCFLQVPLMLSGLMMSGVAAAATTTHTDSFGIVWTLSATGTNVGNAQYDIAVQANTAGFTSNGGVFDNTNTYLNALTIQAQGTADPTASSFTTGPDTAWTTVLGGQNINGCNGNAASSGDVCAYSTPGGQNIAGPGVLMSYNGGILDWVFHVTFASGTSLEQALGTLTNNLFSTHIKADYWSYTNNQGVLTTNYQSVGQISDDASINYNPPCTGPNCGDVPPPPLPEPGMLALMGMGMLGMAVSYSRRRKFN